MARNTGRQRRAEILAAMLAMTAELGPDRVTTRRLAKQLGLSEAALYRHFPGGKAEMWDALAGYIGERLATAWAAADPTPSPLGRLRRLVMIQLREIVNNPALPAILLSRSLHRDNPSLRAGMKRQLARFHGLLRETLTQACAQGEIREAEPGGATWAVIAVLQGTALRWSLSEGGFDLVAEGAAGVDLLLVGLGVEAGTLERGTP